MKNPNMRYKFTKDDQVAGGKIQGVRSRDSKTGFFAITPGSPEDIENRRKGGITQGNIQGRKNVESGELDRIRSFLRPRRPNQKSERNLVEHRV